MTVLAVPRSTAMSRPISEENMLSDMRGLRDREDRLPNATRDRARCAWPLLGRARVQAVTRSQQSGLPRLLVGEPEADLAGSGLVAVARVHEVLGRHRGEVAADRSRLGVVDLGGADEL